jgi:hypothetical protein
MRYTSPILLLLLLTLIACDTEALTDLCLDDLSDKTDYTSGMLVDCQTYMGKKVDRVLVNGVKNEKQDLLEMQVAGYYRLEIFS